MADESTVVPESEEAARQELSQVQEWLADLSQRQQIAPTVTARGAYLEGLLAPKPWTD